MPVWDPASDAPAARTTIIDPLTGGERPVRGLSVAYAAALATGMLPRLLLGQWDMIRRLRQIPDSVDDFVGFIVPYDPIAGTLDGGSPYAATGRARVRNVTLPTSYRHIGLPDIAHLAADPVTREWIERYTPTASLPAPDAAADTTNLLHAAMLWHDVKKHWCIEAQRLDAARVSPGRRALHGPAQSLPGGDAALARPAPVRRRARRDLARRWTGRLATTIAEVLEADRAHRPRAGHGGRRYTFTGGPARYALDAVPAGADVDAAVEAAIESRINVRFPDDGPIEPFLFFTVATADGFRLGVSYDHLYAGGDSIAALLSWIVARYEAPPAPRPPCRAPCWTRRATAACSGRSCGRWLPGCRRCRRWCEPRAGAHGAPHRASRGRLQRLYTGPGRPRPPGGAARRRA